MTRIVPLALALLPLAGCHLSHEREGSIPVPGARDGGLPTDAAVPSDAWAPPDAGPIECALARGATLQATSTRFAAHAPELGWDGEQLGLVVFESDGDIPHPVVSATRVAADLSVAEPLRVVGEESHSWGEAAWDARAGFGLCWNGDPGGAGRTMFRFRDRDGGELAPRLDLDADGGACEGLARARDRWGAVWRHGRGEGGISMRAAVIDDRGVVVGAPIDLDEPTAYPGRSALIAADGDGFVVAVPREGAGLELTRITRDGRASARALIDAPLARYGAIAVHDDGTIGLAIRDGGRDEGGLRFVRVGPDLERLPRETLLVSIGRGVRHPRLVAMPDGWAVLWVEQRESASPASAAVLAHLDRDGVPREPRRILVEGANSGYGGPSVVAHADGLHVAIARPPDPDMHAPEQVFVTRLECERPAADPCAPQDARSSGDDCVELTGHAWDGASCVPVVCGCIGADCDRIAALEAECVADHPTCGR